MILPGNPEAWPSRILDDDCDDDKGFLTDFVRPFHPGGPTQSSRDAAIRQLRDLLGDDYTEREGLAFMAGVVTTAHRLLSDCITSINAGNTIVPLESVQETVAWRCAALVSTAWEAYDEQRAPSLSTLEGMLNDE